MRSVGRADALHVVTCITQTEKFASKTNPELDEVVTYIRGEEGGNKVVIRPAAGGPVVKQRVKSWITSPLVQQFNKESESGSEVGFFPKSVGPTSYYTRSASGTGSTSTLSPTAVEVVSPPVLVKSDKNQTTSQKNRTTVVNQQKKSTVRTMETIEADSANHDRSMEITVQTVKLGSIGQDTETVKQVSIEVNTSKHTEEQHDNQADKLMSFEKDHHQADKDTVNQVSVEKDNNTMNQVDNHADKDIHVSVEDKHTVSQNDKEMDNHAVSQVSIEVHTNTTTVTDKHTVKHDDDDTEKKIQADKETDKHTVVQVTVERKVVEPGSAINNNHNTVEGLAKQATARQTRTLSQTKSDEATDVAMQKLLQGSPAWVAEVERRKQTKDYVVSHKPQQPIRLVEIPAWKKELQEKNKQRKSSDYTDEPMSAGVQREEKELEWKVEMKQILKQKSIIESAAESLDEKPEWQRLAEEKKSS
jgi:hypothetical protein